MLVARETETEERARDVIASFKLSTCHPSAALVHICNRKQELNRNRITRTTVLY